MIKAYRAFEKDGDTSTVVFAESANKAKTLAYISDYFEGVDYIDIRVMNHHGNVITAQQNHIVELF